MRTVIAQRELRNDSAEILRRVENGEEFVVTRNGTAVAQLHAVHNRRAVPRARLVKAFRGVPTIDLKGLREGIERTIDPGIDDPWERRGGR